MKETLTYRPVQDNDISAICHFPTSEAELFYFCPKARHPLTPEQLGEVIKTRAESTVFSYHGEIAGFANFHVFEQNGICAIGNVIVSPRQRNRGVGHFIVSTMTDTAFSKYQAREVHISCFNENVAGLLLYPKLGFNPFRIESRFNKQGKNVALIHFRKIRDQT